MRDKTLLPRLQELKRIAASKGNELQRPRRPRRLRIGRWWTCPCGRLHRVKTGDKWTSKVPFLCGACGAIYPESK